MVKFLEVSGRGTPDDQEEFLFSPPGGRYGLGRAARSKPERIGLEYNYKWFSTGT